MVTEPGDWEWSSPKATVGQAVVPPWLAVDALLGQLADKRSVVRRRYRQFVRDVTGQASICTELNRKIDLGDDGFVERMQAQVQPS